MKSKGLGDDIEKYITKPLGIKKVVDTVAKALDKDCGCESRKNALNKWLPKRGILTQEEHAFLKMFFTTYNGHTIKTIEERDMIYVIYNRVNRTKEEPSSCPPWLARVIKNLRKKFSEY